VDFKTSKYIWKEYQLQVSAYRMALENGENPIAARNPNGTETGKVMDVSGLKAAILQVGYDKNKAGFKFTEVEDVFSEFKVAQQIWKSEINGNTPGFTKREFPIVMSRTTKLAKAEEPGEGTVEHAVAATVDDIDEGIPEPRKKGGKSKSK
jgi:hypothetical protein